MVTYSIPAILPSLKGTSPTGPDNLGGINPEVVSNSKPNYNPFINEFTLLILFTISISFLSYIFSNSF